MSATRCDRCNLNIHWAPPWAHDPFCWWSEVNLAPDDRPWKPEALYPEHGSGPAPRLEYETV